MKTEQEQMFVLKNIPKKPGVYVFKNSKGQIIYIGKALSLKDRVSSYFHQKHLDPKTLEMIAKIYHMDFFVVNSEFEALLLEAKLIKQHRPKYNVSLKDDKSYLYIVVGKENPQRIYLARKAEIGNNLSCWYGPFSTAADARQILKYLRRVFPFRSCKKLPTKPCLYYHLHLCPAPCSSPSQNYSETVSRLKLIFSGKTNNLIKTLEKQMKLAAKELKYEEAQVLKTQTESLKTLTFGWQNIPKEKQEISKTILELRKFLVKYQGNDPITLHRIEGYDVSNLSKDIIVGSLVVFTDGEPDKSQYRKFNLKYNLFSQDDPEGIRQIIRRRLNHSEWLYPQLVVVDGGKTQISAAFFALNEKNLENQIAILGLTKEEEAIVLPQIKNEKIFSWKTLHLSRRSPILQLLQSVRDESHRFAQKYYKTLYGRPATLKR